MISKEDRLKLFENELKSISGNKLHEFAEKLLEGAPDYFFSVPASSTGKYHPQFSLGEGGLVRHTRCVVFFAQCFAESHGLTEREKEILSIGAMAHDILKQGDGRTGYTVKTHPILAANYVKQLAGTDNEYFTDEELTALLGAISSHMGKWGANDGLPTPKTEWEKILHDADYVASRKQILDFDFEPTETVNITPEPPKVFNGDPKDYVLTFGKHAGKTLEEVKSTGYLDWIVKQENFTNKEAQDMAKRFLGITPADPVAEEPAPQAVESSSNFVDDLPF